MKKHIAALLLTTAIAAGQTTQKFSNVQLTAAPAQSTAASVAKVLALTASGVGESVTPAVLWDAIVLSGVATADVTGLDTALAAKQPLADDLTAISALDTTAHGRGLLDDADAAASRASIGVVIGTDVTAPLVFSLRAYGATGDGVSDDGPEIRNALAAASAAGGGLVLGEPGKTYLVVPILVTGTAYTCWRGIAMPANTTLDLQGSTLKAQHQAGSVDGCLIAPAGTEDDAMVTDFGAAGNWKLRNAVLATTSASSVTTGNLLVFLRCEGSRAENVSTGSACAYHFVEFNNCKNITVQNFTILHDAGNGGAFPEIQYDIGNPAAPVGSYAHTPLLEGILLENLQMRSLTANAAQARRIEIGHGVATYRRLAFRGGYYAGSSHDGISDWAIWNINSAVATTCEDILIDGVAFHHNSLAGGGSACINIPDSTNTTVRGFEVRNCRFTGSYRSAVMVGTTSKTSLTAANCAKRRGINIHNNYFAPDQIGLTANQSGTTSVVHVQGCEDAVIANNYELSPATQTNVTALTHYYNSILAINNLRCRIDSNVIVRQQAAISDMAQYDNNAIAIYLNQALAISGTQEVVIDCINNSVSGVHRIGLYESVDPATTWAAGAYTRVRGTRKGNIFHTAGTTANQYFLPTGQWAARAGSLVAGTADSAANGIYLCNGRAATSLTGLPRHVATALFGANIPTMANTCVVLAPRYVESEGPASTTNSADGYFSAVTANGTITAATFSGSGASLTALSATQLTTGTVPDARFPATLPAASGVNLTALNATNVSSGTINPDRLGSGGGAGKFLRYDSTWQTVSGSVATDPIFTAKGMLAVGTAASTAAGLAVGATNGHVLMIDSSTATGLKWAAASGTGDAMTTGTLGQFATTTSAELDTVLGDNAGSGLAIFAAGVSDGGNGATDSGKTVLYAADGSLTATTELLVQNASTAAHAHLADDGTLGIHLAGETNPRELAFPDDILENESKFAATRDWTAAGYQPLDSDLTDLADGSLTGSKVGTGIDAANITTGALATGRLNASQQTGQITFTVGNGTDVITTGYKGSVRMPYGGTITGVQITSEDASTTSGSVVFDVWKDTYANFPPTVADTITASDKPTVTTATKSNDDTLTGWTATFSTDDRIAFNVDSVTSLKKVTITLKTTKN